MPPQLEPSLGPAATDRPPAWVSRLTVRNYKSIAFCDVSLEPLTLFVGRNGAGKSNLLSALTFVNALVTRDLRTAISNQGGKDAIFHDRDTSSGMRFELEVRESVTDGDDRKATWSVEIGQGKRRGRLEILSETLSVTDRQGPCGYTARQRVVHYHGLSPIDMGVEATQTVPDLTTLALVGFERMGWVRHRLAGMFVYNFSPETIRATTRFNQSAELSRNGSNLAEILYQLHHGDDEQRWRFERLQDYLKHVVPDLVRVKPHLYGKNLLDIGFVIADVGRRQTDQEVEFTPQQMSDGTLRVLATLAAGFQSWHDEDMAIDDNPTLIAIEEPETALHPAATNALVDALDELTLRTQVLVSTHSADILDNPTVKPANIRVVERIDGRTVVGQVDAASVEIVRQNLDTLGGLERQNQLEPDQADLRRQDVLADPKRGRAN